MSFPNHLQLKILCIINQRLFFLEISTDIKSLSFYRITTINNKIHYKKVYTLNDNNISVISPFGRNSIMIKYINNDKETKKVYLYFISHLDRTFIIDILLTNSITLQSSKMSDYSFVIQTMNTFISDYSKGMSIQKSNYDIIKKEQIYYTNNDYFCLSEIINNDRIIEKNIILGQYSFIKIEFILLFGTFTRITNKKEIRYLYQSELIEKRNTLYLTKRRKKIHLRITVPKLNFVKTKTHVISISDNLNINKTISSQSSSIKDLSVDDSTMLVEIKHPKTKKYQFQIIVSKYFSKQINYIFFLSKGSFLINNIENNGGVNFSVDNIRLGNDNQIYSLSRIKSIESNYFDSQRLTLLISNQDKEKTLYLDFQKRFDKYVFRSLAYHYMLADLKKERLGKFMNLNITAITWNLANISLPNDVLSCFTSEELKNVDMLVIGVQECAYRKTKEWRKHICTILKHYGFELIASVDMWQMFEMVFIRKRLFSFVDNIYTDSKAMGFCNIVGNKGGMIIAFQLLGYQFVFVNCHLAPKPYKVLERNNMIKNLTKQIRLPNIPFVDFDVAADYMFWLGDMNYRVDYPFQETLDILEKSKGYSGIKKLLLKDQLIKQRRDNRVLYKFIEPEIIFFPTYRREKNEEKFSSMDTIKKNRESNRNYHTYISQSFSLSNKQDNIELNDSLSEDSSDCIISTSNKPKVDVPKLNMSKINNNHAEPSQEIIFEEEKNEGSSSSRKKKLSIEEEHQIKTAREEARIKIDDILEQNRLYEIRQYNNKENQSPSWCDRILVKTQRKIHILFYCSLSDIRHSDHLPVEAKYSIELTTPLIQDYKLFKANQNKIGYYHYNYFTVNFDYRLLFNEEIEEPITLPFFIELSCYFQLNQNPIVTRSQTIRDTKQLEKRDIKIQGFNMPFHQLLLDYPHGKALNIFFVFKLVNSNSKRIDIGYSKYSLEYIELSRKTALNHEIMIDVYFHTRKVGECFFSADYAI